MNKRLILALGLGLMSSLAAAQSVPTRPGDNAPARDVPSTEPLLPGDPAGRPLQENPGTPSRPAGDFARLDANADGKLSRDEAAADAGIRARFKTLDSNSDGHLSEGELNASGSARGEGKRKKPAARFEHQVGPSMTARLSV